MSISPFDSAMLRDLFTDRDVATLFSDTADIRAMLVVEGMLAKVQGDLGVIPADSAAFIHRSSLEVQIDPAGLSLATGQNGVCVPALIAAFRKEMEAPEHAQYAHWGATSQDIIDTGLALRMRQALALIEARGDRMAQALARLAGDHAGTPMVARTYGQTANPTSFGAVAAAWGWPWLDHKARLAALRPRLLAVTLSGAAGNGAALGPKAAETRARLAEALKLADPGRSIHSTRDHVAELAGWLTLVAGTMGKMGEDLLLLAQSDVGEVRFTGAGESSTMPQKQNPVGASVLIALARHVQALNVAVQGAALHRQQRDGAAWFTEWLSLPAMIMGVAKGLSVAADLAETLDPQADAMSARLNDPLGLIHAEALSFALAAHMPRPEAQAVVKTACKDAIATGTPLLSVLERTHPGLGLAEVTDPARAMGDAPSEARAFAQAVADA
ncbi:lyase family protein [Nioella aestuarii]|uniref:lyase family protein n=1 Tax=Nioella aestuarii TaxID=1662864 RepID=UPI003D7F8B72